MMMISSTMPHKLAKSTATTMDFGKDSTGLDCSLCWSASPNSYGTGYVKTKTVRLHRNDSSATLGFSIRGGWEHGIGFYVSEVQPNSLAAKNGLNPGDQIFRINGFPLDRITHDEVIALIRMSTNDLTLRVRSTGIVPQRSRPGDKLTWKRLCLQRPEGSEVSSFIYTRPRSVSSSLTTPSSATVSSDEHNSDDVDLSQSRAIYCSKYNQKHLYIQCHQPGSSLGCSVVNGPLSCPGIFVQNVKDGKLAQKCGLEVGDQIVKVNNVDVAGIGFDGAITMLKSMSNLSLLVRKGVARHIFECREQFDSFETKECHFSSQFQCSKSYINSTVVPVNDSVTTTNPELYALPAPPPPPPPNPYSYYHHQYKTISTTTEPTVPPRVGSICAGSVSATTTNNPTSAQRFCSASTTAAAYSTVQISCDKSHCCCKRQRTVNGTETIEFTGDGTLCTAAASTSGVCTVMVNARHPNEHPMMIPSAAALFADNTHLDTVTNAMANSIRILQEVREKEEKLVEASRKLNEEHQKLCREKEKLENEKKELTERSKECRAIDSSGTYQQMPLFSLNNNGNSLGATGGSSIASTGPSISFLEEIKALGENGGKRHLRPVNSNDPNKSSSDTSSDCDNKLKRLPFGVGNQAGKDADKKRQHELLMEEFRIAHQRMFGGGLKPKSSANTDTPANSSTVESNKENSTPVKGQSKMANKLTQPMPPPPSPQWTDDERVKCEETVQECNGSKRMSNGTRTSYGKEIPTAHTRKSIPGKGTQATPVNKTANKSPCEDNVNNRQRVSANSRTDQHHNRITIKVLSPKIAS